MSPYSVSTCCASVDVREDLLFDFFDFLGQGVEHREVAVDNGVHERVEHVGRAVLQQLRLQLAAPTHFREAQLCAAPDGNGVLRADEDRDFTGLQVLARRLDHVQHDEERRTVFLDLRPLVAVLGVLDGELMQIEFLLEHRQLGRFGILQRHPDKAIGPRQILPDLAQRDVGDSLAALVAQRS